MELNFDELRELVTVLNQTDISELTLKSADFELTLRKQGALSVSTAPPVMGVAPDTVAVAPVASTLSPAPSSITSAPPPSNDSNLVDITSPMVGTFYRSPAPDEPPYVDVGDRIKSGQTVCIIEAMKLMNELETEVSGEIVEILVQNSEPIEFGQPLMRVRPS